MQAFTLIEVLTTTALLVSIACLSAVSGFDSYQRMHASSDLERIIGVLRQARSLAQAGTCRIPPCSEPQPIGVRVASGNVALFQGRQFNEHAVFEEIPLSSILSVETADIVFLPRSGYLDKQARISVASSIGRNRTISISSIGVIFIEPL